MNRRKIGFLGAALGAALLVAGLGACATPIIEIGSPDFSKAKEGSWEGYYDGRLVKVKVGVDAAAGRVLAVRVLQHDCGKGKPAERIVGDIVAKQSLDVDTVSGATFSSKCILKATELALEKAIQ